MLEIKLQTNSNSERTERELQKTKPRQFSSGDQQRKKELQFEVMNRQVEEMKNKSSSLQKKTSSSKEVNRGKEFIKEGKQKGQVSKGKKDSRNDRESLKKTHKRQQIKSQQEVQEEGSEQPDQQDQNESQKKSSTIKVRIAGGILLSIVIIMALVHGLTANINRPFFDQSNNALVGASLMIASIFVVLGFGLTLTYYGQNMFSSFFITLYIVSSTLIISPFLNRFFLNLFFGTFYSSLPTSDININVLTNSNTSSGVDINYWNMKLALCCATSQLIIYFAAISRLQIYKIILANFFFLMTWSLNYGIVTYLFHTSTQPRINDDFNICFVYLFGGFAGLIVIFDVPSRTLVRSSQKYQPNYPKTISVMGIFFLWMSFAITYSIIGRKDNDSTTDQLLYFRLIFYPEGCLGMFFALSSTVLSTAATSIIFGQDNILKVSDLIGSTISGAIMYGPIAGFTQNLAIPITLGIGAGALSTIYKNKILPIVNKRYLIDSMGFLGPFFVVPIIANFLVTPVIVSIYSSASLTTSQLNNTYINSKVGSIIIVYFLVSAIMGMICGMMISWVMRVFKGNQDTFGDRLMFSQDLSLLQIKLDYEQNSTDLFSSESSKPEKSSESKKKPIKKEKTKKQQSL